jgi:hypothetical protein
MSPPSSGLKNNPSKYIFWDITPCCPVEANRSFGWHVAFIFRVEWVSQAENQHESGIKHTSTCLLLKHETTSSVYWSYSELEMKARCIFETLYLSIIIYSVTSHKIIFIVNHSCMFYSQVGLLMIHCPCFRNVALWHFITGLFMSVNVTYSTSAVALLMLFNYTCILIGQSRKWWLKCARVSNCRDTWHVDCNMVRPKSNVPLRGLCNTWRLIPNLCVTV